MAYGDEEILWILESQKLQRKKKEYDDLKLNENIKIFIGRL